MRFFVTIITFIVAAAVSAPVLAQPVGNPLSHSPKPAIPAQRRDVLQERGFVTDLAEKFLGKFHFHRREEIARELEARDFITSMVEKVLGKIHYHKRDTARERLLDSIRRLGYQPQPVIARADFHTEVMPQGWKDKSYQSPPFVNPSAIPRPVSSTAAAGSVPTPQTRPHFGGRPFWQQDNRKPFGGYAAGVRPFHPAGERPPVGAGVRPLPSTTAVAPATQTTKSA